MARTGAKPAKKKKAAAKGAASQPKKSMKKVDRVRGGLPEPVEEPEEAEEAEEPEVEEKDPKTWGGGGLSSDEELEALVEQERKEASKAGRPKKGEERKKMEIPADETKIVCIECGQDAKQTVF